MQLSEEEADEFKIKLIQNFAEAGTQGLGDFIDLILKMDNKSQMLVPILYIRVH